MISSHWNSDTAASRFLTSRPSPLDEIDKTIPSCSVPSDPESVVEHKQLEPNPHHLVSQIPFLFDRRNEMWVRVSPGDGIQAIQLLPYRAGLARRQVWHVRSPHAF